MGLLIRRSSSQPFLDGRISATKTGFLRASLGLSLRNEPCARPLFLLCAASERLRSSNLLARDKLHGRTGELRAVVLHDPVASGCNLIVAVLGPVGVTPHSDRIENHKARSAVHGLLRRYAVVRDIN